MTIIDVCLLTLVNTLVCVLLPRLVTLDWLQVWSNLTSKLTNTKTNDTVVVSENQI